MTKRKRNSWQVIGIGLIILGALIILVTWRASSMHYRLTTEWRHNQQSVPARQLEQLNRMLGDPDPDEFLVRDALGFHRSYMIGWLFFLLGIYILHAESLLKRRLNGHFTGADKR